MLDILALALAFLLLLAIVFGPVFLYRHLQSRHVGTTRAIHCSRCQRFIHSDTLYCIANGTVYCVFCLREDLPHYYQQLYRFVQTHPLLPMKEDSP